VTERVSVPIKNNLAIIPKGSHLEYVEEKSQWYWLAQVNMLAITGMWLTMKCNL